MRPDSLADLNKQELFRLVLDSLLDFVVVVDERLRVVFLNRLFERKKSVASVEECIGKPFFEVFESFAQELDFQTALQRTRTTREPTFVPSLGHLPRTGARQISYKANIVPILFDAGIQGFLFIFESQDELTRRIAVNTQLAEGFSHEIRNIANNILAELAALQDSQDQSFVDDARLELARMIMMARNYSLLERLNFPAREWVDAVPLAARAFGTVERSGHRIQLVIEAPDDLRVYADAKQLQLVLEVVFQNAVDAVRDGGRVLLTGSMEPRFGNIEVLNEGPMIPEDVLPKLQAGEPFTSTKAKSGKGAGMGLFIARHIVEDLHRGRLVLTNRPDEGAVSVLIQLPPSPGG